MNRKKIENWVIFGLKLLPFLMLAVFAIYCHRHIIDNTTVPDINSKVVSNFDYVYSATTFDDFFTNVYFNTTEYSLSSSNVTLFQMTIDEDSSYAIFYNYINNSFLLGSFYVDLFFNTGDYITISFIAENNDSYFIYNIDYFTSSFEGLDISFDESVLPAYSDFINGDLPYNSYYFDYDFRNLELTNITYYDINESGGYFFVDIDYTFKNFDIVNPINAIFIYFNEYLDYVMNFEIFNISGFYDWTVTNWFNNNPPLIYKPVFIILIYELLVDLLVLMYSFITFVIKFAQKWLNGIYNKDW